MAPYEEMLYKFHRAVNKIDLGDYKSLMEKYAKDERIAQRVSRSIPVEKFKKEISIMEEKKLINLFTTKKEVDVTESFLHLVYCMVHIDPNVTAITVMVWACSTDEFGIEFFKNHGIDGPVLTRTLEMMKETVTCKEIYGSFYSCKDSGIKESLFFPRKIISTGKKCSLCGSTKKFILCQKCCIDGYCSKACKIKDSSTHALKCFSPDPMRDKFVNLFGVIEMKGIRSIIEGK